LNPEDLHLIHWNLVLGPTPYICKIHFNIIFLLTLKAKAVPLHATKTLGGRGCIALIHSLPRH
jgi:hypothetical protein